MPPLYAWCFSHGTIHAFADDPWCTAQWVRLEGDTEENALADKQARFGEARFLDHLPLEQQAQVCGIES